MATLDPGIGEKFSRRTKRAINHDGSFNVRRRGGPHRFDAYQWLVQMDWWPFIGVVVAFFGVLNAIFAAAYLLLGLENLPGVTAPRGVWQDFLSALFFSIQTFTSVGYGHVYPGSNGAGLVSSLEALVGVLTFALATGLLYGRFSRPTARIHFSRTAIISRRPDGTPSLQFRIANQRSNILIDLQARVLVKTIEPGTSNQKYAFLPLERDTVNFFPLSWTIVHDITPESPLYGYGPEDYQAQDVEIIIQLKGYDDTFAQDVHARNSYTHEEIEWHRRFIRAYEVDDDGIAVIDLDQLHRTEPLED
ncbi:ion channel [Hymenobacter sp. BT770]|uniref:ion channel n=1 Tax=Hymenobacter sp. BT770 TaxID=2886942 RepID=UPI001D1148C2|nr:ion channel [Hymenobacter sp. BT770]MCC3153755.1 potassium transporter [Hymenobacter sp. BT770]MDO3416889.1 ion channel [Hymenobacter sp. BT770]